MCPNFRDQNEILLGSGQYLFWFKMLKTEFEYSLNCIKYLRLRAPLRTINWSWLQKKNSKTQKYKNIAQLIIGDCEEGVSIYEYVEKTNSLKMRGFDIGVKQVLYANALPQISTDNEEQRVSQSLIACLDY